MLKIILVDADQYQNDILELFCENFSATPLMIRNELNIDFNVDDYLEQEMAKGDSRNLSGLLESRIYVFAKFWHESRFN